MRQPDPQIAGDPQRRMQQLHRDQRQLQRHDQKPDDHRDQEPPRLEVHPGQGVGRKGRHQDRDDRRRNRHGRGVEERLRDAFALQDPLIAREGELRRHGRLHEDALVVVEFGGRGQPVAAIRVHRQLDPVVQRHRLAGGMGAGLLRAGAPGRNLGRGGGQGHALDHPKRTILHLACRIGAIPFGLLGTEEGVPPAALDDLILVAERGDEQPHRRDQPEQHQKCRRDIDRPRQRGPFSSHAFHVSEAPCGRCARSTT